MHGQIDSILHHIPAGTNHLVVTGTLVADTPAEVGNKVDDIQAALTIGTAKVNCSTKSHGPNVPIIASLSPGTPWTMLVGSSACGPASSTAKALDGTGKTLFKWSQPSPEIAVY